MSKSSIWPQPQPEKKRMFLELVLTSLFFLIDPEEFIKLCFDQPRKKVISFFSFYLQIKVEWEYCRRPNKTQFSPTVFFVGLFLICLFVCPSVLKNKVTICLLPLNIFGENFLYFVFFNSFVFLWSVVHFVIFCLFFKSIFFLFMFFIFHMNVLLSLIWWMLKAPPVNPQTYICR